MTTQEIEEYILSHCVPSAQRTEVLNFVRGAHQSRLVTSIPPKGQFVDPQYGPDERDDRGDGQ